MPDSVPVPTPDTAAPEPHTNEYHQSLLEVWHNGKGFTRHNYRRCGFSGSGNCCCGRSQESVLHPHRFVLAAVARERGQFRCVCGKPAEHEAHREAANAT